MAAVMSSPNNTSESSNQSHSLSELLESSMVPRESSPRTSNFLSLGKANLKFATLDIITTQSQSRNVDHASVETKEVVVIRSGNNIKYPFLHQFDIDNYRLCLALCSQTLLWKTIEQSPSLDSWHFRQPIQLVVWCLALLILIAVSFLYVLKCIFYVDLVKEEYFDRIGVNYFFAPWISCMLLSLGVPSIMAKTMNPALCVFVTPVILLELRIYGKWFTGGKRMLSKVANPSTYLSIVGNFVGAMLAAQAGWKEPANFMFAVGFAHYTVLFVTLYQRLPMNLGVPKELNPTFFLVVATPSTASLAWEAISGTFGLGSKMPYFLSLFLLATMIVRINFITGSRFSITWWAYVFPVTVVAIATIKYSEQVRSPIVKIIAFVFSFVSVGTVAILVVTTLLHYLLFRHGRAYLEQLIVSNPSKKRKLYQITTTDDNTVPDVQFSGCRL